MQLTQEQGEAVAKMKSWWAGKRQVFELGGAAGTGKTTIAKYGVAELGLKDHEVTYCAFTGKAALVLSQKGCTPAGTAHSLLYSATQNEQTGEWRFTLNYEKIKDGGIKLVVVDEAPMLPSSIAEDLVGSGVRVLALGDPWQLPPVEGGSYFGRGDPDFLLTEPNRTAADSPIIHLATLVRNGGKLVVGDYGTSRVVKLSSFKREQMLEADQVLCGRNDTRHYLNNQYRIAAGLKDLGAHPQSGERLICLRNNRERSFLNGQMFLVDESQSDGKDVTCTIRPEDYPETLAVKIDTPLAYFNGTESELDWKVRKNCDEFAYAYAITTHKSQGSQFAHTMVLDQSAVFKQHALNWLYTAITRASDRVTVLI